MRREESMYLHLLVEHANRRISSGEDRLGALAKAEGDVLATAEERAATSVYWFTHRIADQVRMRARHETRVRRGVSKRFWHAFRLYQEVLAGAEVLNHQQVEVAAADYGSAEHVPLLGCEELFGGRALRYFLLNSLHARSLTVAGEVLHSLEAGYAEAAAARTRTLYEISVVIWFLSTGGAGQADAVELCERYYVALGLESAKLGWTDELEQHLIAEAERRWGNSFRKPYGWARAALSLAPREQATFAHIERQVEAHDMRYLYLEFNNAVHSGSLNTVMRNDWRRNYPSPTRPECDTHLIRKAGWCAIRFLEFATYSSTKAIAVENDEWDDLLALGPFLRTTEAAVDALIAVPDPRKKSGLADS